ncbi:MAG: serine/threonine-protein kinase, partial [Lentisphaeria bacterium]
REAKLACRIKHANVIAVMDAERDGKSGLYYIVQEFVDGGTVRDLMKKGPLTEAQALDIAIGVAEALAAAAEFGIVHRDIKPENIMLTHKGEVKLADLGIAKEQSERDTGLTLPQVMMGTPAYMAPEQAQDAKNVDARADLYSLGASLYHMLCGAPPYTGDTAFAVLTKAVQEPPPDPRAKRPDLSEPVARLIQRLMAKKKEDRPATAQELLTELKGLRNPLPTAGDLQKLAQELISEVRAVRTGTATATAVAPGRPAAAAATGGTPPRQGRPAVWLAAAAAALVLLLAAGAGLFILLNRAKEPAAETAQAPAAPTPTTTTATTAPGGTTPAAATARPAATPDLARLRRTVDALLQQALAEQQLADPRVKAILDNPMRFVSQKLNDVDPVLVANELVEQQIPVKDILVLLEPARAGGTAAAAAATAPAAKPPLAALLVQSRAANLAAEAVESLTANLAASLTAKGFAVIDPAFTAKQLKSRSVTDEELGAASALRLAQLLNADYLIVASLRSLSAETRTFTDPADGRRRSAATTTLRLALTVLDTDRGATLYGDTVSVAERTATLPNLEIQGNDLLPRLLDAAADKVAGNVAASVQRIAAATPAAATLVEARVTCNIEGATIAVDGAVAGSAPATLRLRPGLHRVWVSHPWCAPWDKTVNITAGQALAVTLLLTDEGIRKFKDLEGFKLAMERLRKSGETDDAVRRALAEGQSEMLKQSHIRFDGDIDTLTLGAAPGEKDTTDVKVINIQQETKK